MANVKFSELTELTSIADDDLVMITDDSESSVEKSKYITFRTLEKRILPPGKVSGFMRTTAPQGWLVCDGAAVSRASYADLYSALGDIFGDGDGSTTFNLPDLRGYFLRGWDNGAENDPDAAIRTDRGDGTGGDVIGSIQADEFKSHTHYVASAAAVSYFGYNRVGPGSAQSDSGSSGGNETRPKNINVLYCIKF